MEARHVHTSILPDIHSRTERALGQTECKRSSDYLWHQLDHIRKRRCSEPRPHHGTLEHRQILLMGKALIHRHEHIERGARSTKQRPVAQPGLPLLGHRHNLELRVEVRRDTVTVKPNPFG